MSDNPTAGANAIAAARAGGYWKEIALIAALIAAGVIGYSWLKAHDAWMRFQVESRIKDQQIALRDKQAATDRQTIEQLKKQTQTTQQIVREIPKVISLPAPVQESLVGSRSPLANDQRQTTKDPSAQVLPEAPPPQQTGLWFPPADVKPLFDRLADCKAMESQLSACQQNYLDMKKERDLAVKAHSGSFWQRAKQIGIGIAIGGAIGYAVHR
jgi:preprotein translocase subunit Sss1